MWRMFNNLLGIELNALLPALIPSLKKQVIQVQVSVNC